MNFLKKLGQGIAFGLSLVTGFGPLFSRTVPAAASTVNEVTDDLTKVMGIVQSVEVVAATLTDKSLSGADKLKAATPQVVQVILQSELMIDHATGKQAQIADEQLFRDGCSAIADGVVKVLNSRKG